MLAGVEPLGELARCPASLVLEGDEDAASVRRERENRLVEGNCGRGSRLRLDSVTRAVLRADRRASGNRDVLRGRHWSVLCWESLCCRVDRELNIILLYRNVKDYFLSTVSDGLNTQMLVSLILIVHAPTNAPFCVLL